MRRRTNSVYRIPLTLCFAFFVYACSENSNPEESDPSESSNIENNGSEIQEQHDTENASYPEEPDWEIKLDLLEHENGPLSKAVILKVNDVDGTPLELYETSVVVVAPRIKEFETTKLTLNQLEAGYYAGILEVPVSGDYHFVITLSKFRESGVLDMVNAQYKLAVLENTGIK
ncbi:hypothetical protein [Kordiimonas aquimaris]|uniref:hypothetical protein n=1 Tax=Kordiimonas aquimaris TaxID=707591 RepID=UPI0021CEBEF2|nr:hypothetical protein [Kordiimonas aquimaris]